MEASGAGGEGGELGVDGFGAAVADGVIKGVPDQLPEPFQGGGEPGELGDAAACAPGDEPGQQRSASLALGLEDFPELFLPVNRPSRARHAAGMRIS